VHPTILTHEAPEVVARVKRLGSPSLPFATATGGALTSQPEPAPTDPTPARQTTGPLRELAALVLVGANALLLLVGLINFLIPHSDTFRGRAGGAFSDFVGVAAIVLPLLAVLLATHLPPPVPRAKLITQVALIEYAVSAVFGAVALLGWLITTLAAVEVRDAFTGLLVRVAWLAIFGIAAFVVYKLWRTLYYVPKPKPQPGMYGQSQAQSYGQPYGQPGQPGQPYGQPGQSGQPGYPAGYPQGYGQPGGYGQPAGAAPGYPATYGQPPAPGQPSGDATQIVPSFGAPAPSSAPPSASWAPSSAPPAQSSAPPSQTPSSAPPAPSSASWAPSSAPPAPSSAPWAPPAPSAPEPDPGNEATQAIHGPAAPPSAADRTQVIPGQAGPTAPGADDEPTERHQH
jgi:hypothetical protein